MAAVHGVQDVPQQCHPDRGAHLPTGHDQTGTDSRPLRGERSRAAFIEAGSTNPSPNPQITNHSAVHPVPLLTAVVAPRKRPTAMKANPLATTTLAPSLGADDIAAPPRELVPCNRVARAAPATSPAMSGNRRMPLPKGSCPITPWKYCGMAKSSPNMAKETKVASTVPQVNRADWNSPRSTNGSR